MSKPKDDSYEKSRLKQNKTNYIAPSLNKNINLRIMQKNLVYVIGLSSNIANKEILIKQEFFGQYGSITKLVVNKTKAYNPLGPNGPSYSAYITYSSHQEASIAILSIDNTTFDEHLLRASFGTTKYCTYYLKGLDCSNKECLYLHYLADKNDIIHRDDMNTDKSIFVEQQLLAIQIADIYNPEIIKKIKALVSNNIASKLPSPDYIFSKDIVIQNDPKYNRRYKPYTSKNYRKRKDYKYAEYEYYEDSYKNLDNIEEIDYSGEKYSKESKNILGGQNIMVNYRKTSDSYSNSYTNIKKKNNNKKLNSFFKQKVSKEYKRKELDKQELLNNTTLCMNEGEYERDNLIEKKSNINQQDEMSIINNQTRSIRKIFEKQEKSRFKFADDNIESEEKVSIPDYISEIIKRKISLHYFIRKYFFEYDEKLEERLLSNIISDDWKQFFQTLKQNCTVN